MSRVVGPLLSLGASGTIGGAITFSNWKGINTARIKSNPSNPKTTTQMAGRAKFAVAGKVSKVTDPTLAVATYLKTITPAQQSYASFFSKELLGTNNVNIDASIAAYKLVGNATVAGYFNTGALTAGIENVDLDGTANTKIDRGAALWAAYTAAYRLGVPTASTVATSVDATKVNAFVLALTGN